MIRIVKLTGKYYGRKIGEDLTGDGVIDEIEEYVIATTPVILVDDLEDLEVFDIDPDSVIMNP